MKAAKMTTIAAMEPLLPDDNKELEDLATDLVAKASGLATRLHPVLRASVGDLVRSMNCYYSNLIEGHNTLPVDIDRAMNNELATEPERRNLQLEARAHVRVQTAIDDLAAAGRPLAMLSNAPGELAEAISRLPVAAHFGHLIFSCELKSAKPDPECYDRALARIGARADEVIFVDDRSENVAAAAALGLRSVHFTSPSAARAAVADRLAASG